MAHITIEYMIALPILIVQIILFPLTANWLMNIWVDSRRTLALEEAASHLGSTLQQMYFTLNHDSVPAGTKITQNPGLPPFIESYHYIVSAKLRTTLDPALNSSKILTLTAELKGTGRNITTTVLLGINAVWIDSLFVSNSTSAYIIAEKLPNGTIALSFGGLI
ncbi:hypothetical protein H5T51_02355 [Candidatus Bathyarchaeota archaeon]|nr:hypothetical protein [Candidatus Bathyarchaeota archaeon]